ETALASGRSQVTNFQPRTRATRKSLLLGGSPPMRNTSRRTTLVVILLVTFAAFAAFAQSAPTQYVILSKSQGKGSTDFANAVNAAGGTIVSNLDRIGVVVATSSNPDFASAVRGLANVQDVAEDPEVNFLPGETAIQADATPT